MDLTEGQLGEELGGDLLLDGRIARGGMADVYSVQHRTTGQRYALKVLHRNDERLLRRMHKESEMMAAIRSPHVVGFRSELRIQGRPALLMEFVAGPTLHAYLRHREPTLGEALALFRGVCIGIGEAHAQGVIHRDIKPSNVVLHIDGDVVTPKVLDFGVAKDLIDDSGLISDECSMGTPRHMSPEQFSKDGPTDRRTDLWSLGVLLYRMVCGRQPFDRSGSDLLVQITMGRFAHPRALRPNLPQTVERAIYGLLEPNPALRISSVPNLLALLDGRITEVVPPGDEIRALAARPRTRQPTTIYTSSVPQEVLQQFQPPVERAPVPSSLPADTGLAPSTTDTFEHDPVDTLPPSLGFKRLESLPPHVVPRKDLAKVVKDTPASRLLTLIEQHPVWWGMGAGTILAILFWLGIA